MPFSMTRTRPGITKGRLPDIAQQVPGVDEVVAGIAVSIVLHYGDILSWFDQRWTFHPCQDGSGRADPEGRPDSGPRQSLWPAALAKT